MNFFSISFTFFCVILISCSEEKPFTQGARANRGISYKAESRPYINPDTSYLLKVFTDYELVNILEIDSSIHINLRYADTANFLHRNFYDGLRQAYFPCEVAIAIANAQFYLKKINSNYSLQVFDATRPLHIQKMMWDSLKMPPNHKYNYLSPPWDISLHNYGAAVDITIVDLQANKQLDMGSAFDSFNKLSEPIYEWKFLKSGELSETAYANRKLLRKVMQAAKFMPIPSEWWHFNYCGKSTAAARFELIK
jgi:zinc D-Ala-D-Ala dipeptidase